MKTKLLLIITILLFATNSYTYNWEKGTKIFKLNMSILNIEKILVKHNPSLKVAQNYYSKNFYFFTDNNIINSRFYHDDPNISIGYNSNEINKSLSAKITLKRVFGYKLGKLNWLTNSKVLSSANKTQQYKLTINTKNDKLHKKITNILKNNLSKNNMTKEGNTFIIASISTAKAKTIKNKIESLNKNITINIELDFNPEIVYSYRSFPIEKFNPLINSIELGFIDKSLFRIMYEIKLSPQQYKILKENLNTNYAKYKKTINKNTIHYQNDKQSIKLLSKQNNNIYNVQLTYIQKDKHKQLKDYKLKSKIMLSKLIRHSKYKYLSKF